MSKGIMIQGTASNAGKSLIAAALCRIFRQDGYKVAPFKAQNMALNSFITRDGFEMGRAQAVQAEAAGILPDVRMNPVLLKPVSDCGSQVIVCGKPVGNMSAAAYYDYKPEIISHVMEAYESLAAEYDIIVLEGAGSPAEINLKSVDIVNMGMAKLAKSPVLLVGDIDRGGVFASVYGTVKLLDADEQNFVKGIIINKFRGDADILRPGLSMLEDLLHIPVTGVVPYANVDIDDEDSLSERLNDDGRPDIIDIAVIRLPRLSNYTDFNPLQRVSGVKVRYVSNLRELKNPDLIILPGSKNTIADLIWLRQNGLEAAVKKFAHAGSPVLGICGGYQMMGARLFDPYSVESGGDIHGMGLLPVETVFSEEKTTVQVTGYFGNIDGIFKGLSGLEFTGYEIHMGQSELQPRGQAFTTISRNGKAASDGAFQGNCAGSYVHGIFESQAVAEGLISELFKLRGVDSESIGAVAIGEYKEKQYDLLAQVVREALDMPAVYRMLEEGI